MNDQPFSHPDFSWDGVMEVMRAGERRIWDWMGDRIALRERMEHDA